MSKTGTNKRGNLKNLLFLGEKIKFFSQFFVENGANEVIIAKIFAKMKMFGRLARTFL
jgi:hypothetical protein